METSNKSFVTFLAAATAAAAAAIFLKSDNGKKVKNSFTKAINEHVRGIRNIKSPDWMDDLGLTAKTTTNKFKERIGL